MPVKVKENDESMRSAQIIDELLPDFVRAFGRRIMSKTSEAVLRMDSTQNFFSFSGYRVPALAFSVVVMLR